MREEREEKMKGRKEVKERRTIYHDGIFGCDVRPLYSRAAALEWHHMALQH